jgi:hypothetical protein
VITTSVTSSNLVTQFDIGSGEERKEIIQQSSLLFFLDCRRGQSNVYLNLPFGVCISLLFTKLRGCLVKGFGLDTVVDVD